MNETAKFHVQQAKIKNTYKLAFTFVIFLFCACLTLPVQPPLTTEESQYFAEVNKNCQCKVSREVNAKRRLEASEKSNSEYYLLLLDSINCEFLSDISLRQKANELAKQLEIRVLSKSSQYSAKEVSIMYSCDVETNSNKFKSFTYSRKDLLDLLKK